MNHTKLKLQAGFSQIIAAVACRTNNTFIMSYVFTFKCPKVYLCFLVINRYSFNGFEMCCTRTTYT
jgi:hypothetical protein